MFYKSQIVKYFYRDRKNILPLFVLLALFLPKVNFSAENFRLLSVPSISKQIVEHSQFETRNNCCCKSLTQGAFEFSPMEIEEDDDHFQNRKGKTDPALFYSVLFCVADFTLVPSNLGFQKNSISGRILSGAQRLLSIQLLRI